MSAPLTTLADYNTGATAMASEPALVAVIAVARNGIIGRNGGLPWHMPSDLQRFRDLTIGRPMIMGRRTFEAIGRALPGRESVVVSRNASVAPADHVHWAPDLARAVGVASVLAKEGGADAIAVIGGSGVVAGLEPRLQRMHLTLIDLCPEGDTEFPMPDPWHWRETARQRGPRDPADEADCVFIDYERWPEPASVRSL